MFVKIFKNSFPSTLWVDEASANFPATTTQQSFNTFYIMSCEHRVETT